MRPLAERWLPAAVAAFTAALSVFALHALTPRAATTALTVRRAVAAGDRVPPGDLVRGPVRPFTPPTGPGGVYASVALQPGEPLRAGDLTAHRPPRLAALGAGMVAENVTLASTAVPAGASAGSTVALAGAPASGVGAELLAEGARVLAVTGVAASAGSPASVVFTLALPLPSALVVSVAARQGTLTLLPLQVPESEAAR